LVAGTGGDDNVSFQIVGDELQNNIVFDVDLKSSYSIRVRTDDNKGGTFEKSFVITITEPNQAPADIALSNSSIVETVALNTKIGTFTSTDGNANDTHIYSLVTGTGSNDNASFKIEGGDLKSNALFDFVTKSLYSIRVLTDDQNGGAFEKIFEINITAEPNQDPADIALSNSSIVETVALNTKIGTFASTDGNAKDTHTYSLVTGTGSSDNASFKIAGDELQNAIRFDVAVKSSYSIRVRTDDQNGGTFERVFNISITAAVKTAQTITFELTKNEIFANEGPVILLATASSGLPIFFSVISGPGQVSVDQLTILGPGEILIEASQPGNASFAPAPKVSRKLTVKIVTGIEEDQLAYSVYPNPTTDNIKIETHKGEASVYIIDLTGRVSKQQTFIGQTTVDIQNLPSGVYVMKVKFKNGGTFIERIVKN
jgi:hypothetical protein